MSNTQRLKEVASSKDNLLIPISNSIDQLSKILELYFEVAGYLVMPDKIYRKVKQLQFNSLFIIPVFLKSSFLPVLIESNLLIFFITFFAAQFLFKWLDKFYPNKAHLSFVSSLFQIK